MSSLSCHILDTAQGTPATGIPVELVSFETRDTIAKGETNEDGRVRFDDTALVCGNYTLRFLTKPYCETTYGSAFFPLVEVHFHVDDEARHYHVPLLLSPYSYSTYRGS